MQPDTDLPRDLQTKLCQALDLLDDLSVEDQLEVSCLLVGTVLKAARAQFTRYPESQAVYNKLCALAGSWVELEIAPLWFDRTRQDSWDDRGSLGKDNFDVKGRSEGT